MLGTEGLLPDAERALIERLGLRVLALGIVKHRQVVEARGHIGMLGTEGLLPDGERALIERLGLRVLALGAIEHRQVVEALGHIGMLGTEGLLADGERLFEERMRLRISPQVIGNSARHVEVFRVVRLELRGFQVIVVGPRVVDALVGELAQLERRIRRLFVSCGGLRLALRQRFSEERFGGGGVTLA